MYHIIMNPTSKSGKGLSIWRTLQAILSEKGIPYMLHESTYTGHVTELTRQITSTQQKINLILLGGDGTINEALQGIQDFDKVSIGYIPTGSSNDLARALKLSRDPAKLLRQILDGTHAHMMDLGILTYESDSEVTSRLHRPPVHKSRYFIVSSGIGFDAAVCEEALHSKIKDIMNKLGLGKLTYLGIALRQLFASKAVSGKLTLEDNAPVDIGNMLFTACMLHRFEGGGFMFAPDADARDGLLNLCAVGDLPKLLILFALPTAFRGKHYMFRGITPYRSGHLTIETTLPLWVHTDGEVARRSDHICVTCEKDAIQIMLP